MIYTAGLSSKEPCRLMSRHLDCLVMRDGGGDRGCVEDSLPQLCEEEHAGTRADVG